VFLETHGADGGAASLERAVVAGRLRLRPSKLNGSTDLTGAQVGGYVDDPTMWPRAIGLNGFAHN
jgi:hypothetical protein